MKKRKRRRIFASRKIKIVFKPGREIKSWSTIWTIWTIWMMLRWILGNGAKTNSRKRDPASTPAVRRRNRISVRSVTSRSIARASSLVTCSSTATHGRISVRSAPRASRPVRIFLGIWRSTTSPRSFTRAPCATSRRAQNHI